MEFSVLGYMHDQPRALRETFKNRDEFLEPYMEMISKKKYKKILFFGSGTSYNVSKIAEYYFKHIVGIDAKGEYPTVFNNYEKADWSEQLNKEEILFMGISQSGTSISTMNVMKKATEAGYDTCVITENLNSEITNYVDDVLHLLCGEEKTPPETRGYTVSLLQIYLMALSTAMVYGSLSKSKYIEEIKNVETFLENYDTALKEAEIWYENNKTTIVNSDRIYVLGYGVDYGSALEGMLKIGEMLRLPTIGYEIEEFVHGPTMAITEKQTILLIGSDEIEWERCLQFRNSFKKYTKRVHLITCKEVVHDDRDLVFSTKANKYLSPIMYTLPFQFVAAKGAKDIGIDTNINPFKEELGHRNE